MYSLDTDGVANIRYSFRDSCPFLSVHPISGAISTKLVTSAQSLPHTCMATARNSVGDEDFMELKINVCFSSIILQMIELFFFSVSLSQHMRS